MGPLVVSPTTIRRWILGLAAVFLAVGANAILTRAQGALSTTTSVPGLLSDGTTLLPNGWRIAPVGRHLKTGSLPLNLVISPDGRYAVVTNNGVTRPSLSRRGIWKPRTPDIRGAICAVRKQSLNGKRASTT